MQQRNITYCNIRTKTTAMRDATSEQKETNTRKKYDLLQHQNKVTTISNSFVAT
jgi:hypothetical protein